MADSSFHYHSWSLTNNGAYLRLDKKYESSEITSYIGIEKISKDTLLLKNR